MTDPTTRSVPVPGGRLHVLDEGAGRPVLLLHAGIADHRAWDDLVPHLLAAGCRAVRYDLRGFGSSETEPVPFSNRADAIAVLDALEIGRACLVGNSVGGQIAIDTAVEHPDHVSALVTLGAGLGGFDAPLSPEEEAVEAEIERLEEAGDPDAIADFDVRLWGDGPGQPEGRLRSDLRSRLHEMARRAAEPGRASGTPIRLDPPAARRLNLLAMPVTAVAGALDERITIAMAEHLARSVPDGRAVLVPDVAHMIAMEAPAEVARLIVATIERAAPA